MRNDWQAERGEDRREEGDSPSCLLCPWQSTQTSDCHANVSHNMDATYQASKGQESATDLTVANSFHCTSSSGSAGPSVLPLVRPIDLSNGYEHCSSALLAHSALLDSGKTLVELSSSLELVTRAHLHKLPFISRVTTYSSAHMHTQASHQPSGRYTHRHTYT